MSRGNTTSILDLLRQRASFKRDWISDAKHRVLADLPDKGQPPAADSKPAGS